jgi:hypothetical protein
MKAKYDPKAKTKFTTSHRRENGGFLEELSVISLSAKPFNGRIHPALIARIYIKSTKSANTACLWINHGENHASGSGQAGGYGYHRPSEALERAINNAGFTLSESIGGVGEGAMESALLAIAKTLGIKRPAIHRAHA